MPSVRFELTSLTAAVFETAMYTIPSQGRNLIILERVAGVEPASSAWKAEIIAVI